MAKKPKNDIPNPNSVSNRDVIQRLNFLYQASVYLNNVHSSSAQARKRNEAKMNRKTVKLNDLSRSYIETMKTVGTKTTVQLDPSVKRTLCKGCNIVLIPGSTASVRTKMAMAMEVDSAPPPNAAQSGTSQAAVTVTDNVPAAGASEPEKKPEKRKRKEIPPRLPPLFARDAGHVVFAGNEQLPPSNGSWNDGIFIT
ncbi:Rpr2-domain-containing protein [Gymnopus androsaceus JB14]|uniref:Rpr2-domain-containing protein n=1 Tax=Gymnopus androsaceus JB14 TaxID=1447944 RepID=A0A6A4IGC9_9AGAR|nr:Rpr2-domain-containing protein [Gymnopus androsaceus JB14]